MWLVGTFLTCSLTKYQCALLSGFESALLVCWRYFCDGKLGYSLQDEIFMVCVGVPIDVEVGS